MKLSALTTTAHPALGERNNLRQYGSLGFTVTLRQM
jgi:hypothetical protein